MLYPYPTYYNLNYRWSKHINATSSLFQSLVDGSADDTTTQRLYNLHISDKDIVAVLTHRRNRSFTEFLEYITTEPKVSRLKTKTLADLRNH